MSEFDWSGMAEMVKRSEWFDVSKDDFSMLEIQAANAQFSYFYNSSRRSLVKQFLLGESAQVALLCEIRLAVKGTRFSPRVRLTRVHKPKLSEPGIEDVSTNTVALKATVSTDGGHENFIKLMAFLLSVKEVDADVETFRMASATDEEILRLVRGRSRGETVSLVTTLLESSVSEQEISLINNRKGDIAYFEKLLVEPEFFDSERQRLSKTPEALWQDFFERATWIFGYGLSLVGHESLAGGKLEQITTGANIWTGAGKRSDAALKSRALISTLLFAEIKRHDTPLLKPKRYREPDIYTASDELVGGVAQLQKTVRKAYRSMKDQIEKYTAPDGTPTGLDFSTTKARQVLLVGHLAQFRNEHGVNGEQVESFELFRRAHHDIEVLTFDELLARARFIVEG